MNERNMQDPWQKLNEEYEDIIFRMAAYNVARQEGEALRAEMEQLRQEVSPYPTDLQLRRFKKQLAQERSAGKWPRRWQRVAPLVNIAAVTVLALVIVLSALVMNVEAVREQVVKTLLVIKEDDSTWLQVVEMNPQWDPNPNHEFGMYYLPTYLPEGFAIDENMYHPDMEPGMMIYINPEGEYISIIEEPSASGMKLGGKYTVREETILIEGREAYLTEGTNGVLAIYWPLEDFFSIALSTASEEETLKVMASLRPVE